MAQDQGPSIPASLGRYRILRRLGAGGMAEVFLAKSTGAEGIEKLLVVKRILPTFARSSKFITMFLEEAKIATRLNHPNIVQVYAFEQIGGEDFLLAMEFVDGLDLGRLLSAARRAKVKVPAGIAAFVVMEVARGLDYAHRRRDDRGEPMEIVHRDVSPQNVLLSYDGVVKVTDFGIAKARMVSEETGVIKGKFSYMSPEQARGEHVDGRSDVYALGVVFAELLMGRAMYPGKHGLDVLEKVRRGEITLPDQVVPSTPPEVVAICAQALAHAPSERFQTARAFGSALGQWLHQQEEVYNHEAVERFAAKVAPREKSAATQGDSDGGAHTAATLASAIVHADSEFRERRHVVVAAGVLRSPGNSPAEGAPRLDRIRAEASRVLADIAYKADAVLSWPDDSAPTTFRMILGLRRASVHDPLTAMRLGLDTIDALVGLSTDPSEEVSVSIGVSRGVVSTVRDPSGRLLRYEPVGQVVEMAERLAEEGGVGEVLVAGEVYRLARRVFVFDEDTERTVTVGPGDESAPSELRAHRLVRARTRQERAADALAAPGDEAIVGRTDELRAIAAAYDEAVAVRRSGYLAISGELGMGKTTLVSAAIDALDPPPRVLHAECAFGTSDVPFATAAELVRSGLAISDDMGPHEARARLWDVARELLNSEELAPVVEGLEPLVVPESRDDGEEAYEGNRAIAIARATRLLLDGLARRGPLLVWVDALQWADGPSLELLANMVRDTYPVPLVAVFSTRPEARAERVLSAVPHIELGDLNEEERRTLIRARFGKAEVAPDVENAVVERGGGNPFFITELVEALTERGAVAVTDQGQGFRVERNPDVPIALPTTLEGVIAARLDELPEDPQRALRWLAVAGPGHSAKELSEMAKTELGPALGDLSERGLVQKSSGDSWNFASSVVRHVAYDTMAEEVRVQMHRQVGAWLSASRGPVAPVRIARHLERAGDRLAAAQAYLRAASAARAIYSNREALRFYGRALALLPEDSPHRFYAHEAREQILRGLGRLEDRHVELDAMHGLAEQGDDPALVALSHNRRARYHLDSARTEGVRPLLDRALAAASRAADHGAEVEALKLSATLAQQEGNTDQALAACDRALIRCGIDRQLLAARGSVLVRRATLLRLVGRLDEAVEANAEAIVVFRRLGIKRNEAMALHGLGIALDAKGDYEDAMACIRASVALDREIGDRMHLGHKLSDIGRLYAEMGDAARSLEFLRHAERVFEAFNNDAHRVGGLCALVEVLLDTDHGVDDAAEKLDQARRIADRTGDVYDQALERIVRTELEFAAGRYREAERAAREGVELTRRGGAQLHRAQAVANYAWILARNELSEESRQACEQLQEILEDRLYVDRVERVWLGYARALDLLGDADGAREAYREAQEVIKLRSERLRDADLRRMYQQTAAVRALCAPQPSIG